jgi:hypothetical protein
MYKFRHKIRYTDKNLALLGTKYVTLLNLERLRIQMSHNYRNMQNVLTELTLLHYDREQN